MKKLSNFSRLGILLALGACARPVPQAAGPKHPVTDAMWASAKALTDVSAPIISLPDGRTGKLVSLPSPKPSVIYFIKDGCPCSVDFEPLIQKLAKRWGEKVSVIGVLNGDKKLYENWMKVGRSPHPVLLDPGLKAIKAFRAERSVYTALLTADGTVVKLWPGYSKAMLTELNAEVEKVANLPNVAFDGSYAPTEMTSGCSFYSDDPGA